MKTINTSKTECFFYTDLLLHFIRAKVITHLSSSGFEIACESTRFFRLQLLISPAEKDRRYFSEEEKRRPEIRLRFAS